MPDFDDKNVLKPLINLAQQLIFACCSSEIKDRPSFENICDTLAENEFKLVSLSQEEAKEVSRLIKQYKKQV